MWEFRKQLSKKLKELKGEMTEREFSRQIGIGQATLNRFLNCNQSASLDTLETICSRLKINLKDLFK